VVFFKNKQRPIFGLLNFTFCISIYLYV